MLDGLIIFSLLTLVAQIVYAQILVRDRDPFNSFLAGVFCSIGQFALAGKYIFEREKPSQDTLCNESRCRVAYSELGDKGKTVSRDSS